MSRTDSTAVTALLVDVESGVSLDQFITVANIMVTKHCTDAAFTVDELEVIERYLAAHLYCISRPRPIQEKAGDVSENKQHVEALGLDATEFGQMVKRLDWSGALAALDARSSSNKRTSVSATWMGEENDNTVESILF